jgi:tetratricopeptide (TPR) repeat protein
MLELNVCFVCPRSPAARRRVDWGTRAMPFANDRDCAATRWLAVFAMATSTVSGLVGCVGRTGPRAPLMHVERVAPPTAQVSDDAFAAAVHDLLVSDPGSAERAMRLTAVEGRQMARAGARFKSRAVERGLDAVSGAIYLVHVGDRLPGVLGDKADAALEMAVHELSLRGDEGRAHALYDLLLQVGPASLRPDVLDHLAALEGWMRDAVANGGPVANAGAIERVAVRRRLMEPSADALSDAVSSTTSWIQRSVQLRDKFRKSRVTPPREEGTEAWRALETGPIVLASLYLRDGDIGGAMAALDRAQARDLLESERPQLAAALVAAAQEAGAAQCLELLRQLKGLTARAPGREEDDFIEDRDLFGAATFGVAAECYRLDPTVVEVAFTVGVALQELGMAEATPAVLVEAVRAHPDSRMLSDALGLLLDVMAREEEAGDADAARRAFKSARPLLAVASLPALAGKVHPSAARVRAAMGEVELREGRIDAARALLKQSADQEKSGGVLLSLARIAWRDGQWQLALDHLRDALSANDSARDPALRGEVLLFISDITRDKGDIAAARTPLTEALKELVQSRNVQDADARARVERMLARVLDRFGAAQPAQRALERAYAAAPGDKRQAAQTIELLIGRAFVRGDLAQARDGLARAVTVDLSDDDLVYFALWVRLLEKQLRVPSDGTPDRVFVSVPDDGRWVATLARYGEGKLKGDELIARAVTPIQKYEALFYAAMDHRAAGDTKGGDELLRMVVAGTGVELSEVTLARDILDPSKSQLGGPLPPDVSIP